MYKTIFLVIFLLFNFTIFSQIFPPPPPPGYENSVDCAGPGAGNIDYWVTYFNDTGTHPDNGIEGDCISGDWIQFWWSNNGSGFNTSYNPNCETDPSIDCWMVVDFNTWQCCPSLLSGGGGGGSGSGGPASPCFFSVACDNCPDIDSWVECLSNCTGC